MEERKRRIREEKEKKEPESRFIFMRRLEIGFVLFGEILRIHVTQATTRFNQTTVKAASGYETKLFLRRISQKYQGKNFKGLMRSECQFACNEAS